MISAAIKLTENTYYHQREILSCYTVGKQAIAVTGREGL
jgi:hypothetical protein